MYMGYKIEISFGFSKKTNEYKQHIISESIKKGCDLLLLSLLEKKILTLSFNLIETGNCV